MVNYDISLFLSRKSQNLTGMVSNKKKASLKNSLHIIVAKMGTVQ